MNDQMQQVLTNLANKLGVAVPYLWAVLVKQVRIDAIVEGISCLIAASIFFFLFRVAHLAIQKNDRWASDLALKQFGKWTFMVIGVLIIAFWVGIDFSALIYPEGAALRVLTGR